MDVDQPEDAPRESRQILHEGLLTKQGGKIKTWKKRWFTLDKEALRYYVNEADSKVEGKEKGAIYLSLIQNVTRAPDKASAFIIQTDSRDYKIVALNAKNCDEWINALEKERCVPSTMKIVPENSPELHLEVMAPDDVKGNKFIVNTDGGTVGSSAEKNNTIVIQNSGKSVSRVHCRVIYSVNEMMYYVEDNKSANGTFVMVAGLSTRVQRDPVPVPRGAVLTLGEVVMAVTYKSKNDEEDFVPSSCHASMMHSATESSQTQEMSIYGRTDYSPGSVSYGNGSPMSGNTGQTSYTGTSVGNPYGSAPQGYGSYEPVPMVHATVEDEVDDVLSGLSLGGSGHYRSQSNGGAVNANRRDASTSNGVARSAPGHVPSNGLPSPSGGDFESSRFESVAPPPPDDPPSPGSHLGMLYGQGPMSLTQAGIASISTAGVHAAKKVKAYFTGTNGEQKVVRVPLFEGASLEACLADIRGCFPAIPDSEWRLLRVTYKDSDGDSFELSHVQLSPTHDAETVAADFVQFCTTIYISPA